MLEELEEKLSATQDKGSEGKTRKNAKKDVPDLKPTPEHDPENRKANFRADISQRNGKELYPLDIPNGLVLVTLIKDGQSHRRLYSEKQIADETKANGGFLYILYAPDGKSAVIDYDKDKGRFYVKAFLARVNKLLEVSLIKIGLWLKGFHIVLDIVFFIVLMLSVSGLKQELKAVMENSVTAQVQQVRKEFLEKSISAPDPTNAVKNDASEAQIPKELENSHPGRLIR